MTADPAPFTYRRAALALYQAAEASGAPRQYWMSPISQGEWVLGPQVKVHDAKRSAINNMRRQLEGQLGAPRYQSTAALEALINAQVANDPHISALRRVHAASVRSGDPLEQSLNRTDQALVAELVAEDGGLLEALDAGALRL